VLQRRNPVILLTMPAHSNPKRLRSMMIFILLALCSVVLISLINPTAWAAAQPPQAAGLQQIEETPTPLPTAVSGGTETSSGSWALFGGVILAAMFALIAYGVVFVGLLSRLRDRLR